LQIKPAPLHPEEELGNLGLSPPLRPEEERAVEAGFLRGVQGTKESKGGKGGKGGKKVGTGGTGGGSEGSTTFEVVNCVTPEDCTTFEYKFGETGTEHLLRVPVPLEALRGAARRGEVVELQFGGGGQAEVVAQPPQPKKTGKKGGGTKEKKRAAEGKKGKEDIKNTKKARK
jgi:hypothetical protein